MFKALFRRNTASRDAHALYGAVVARARDPRFYQEFGVPDTFDGRFEMLVMHLFMLHARLKDEALSARHVSQLVFDAFIDDMDSALREAAVGDQTVPKRIAKMTQVFYGRTGAFEAALAAKDTKSEVAAVITRNLYPDDDSEGREHLLADYMVSQVVDLENKTVAQIVSEHAIFDQAFSKEEKV